MRHAPAKDGPFPRRFDFVSGKFRLVGDPRFYVFFGDFT
jgi:hypothetical protein